MNWDPMNVKRTDLLSLTVRAPAAAAKQNELCGAYHDEQRARNYDDNRAKIAESDNEQMLADLKKDIADHFGRVVIIGAGPSLHAFREYIPKLQRHCVLIFADTAAQRAREYVDRYEVGRLYTITVDSDPLGILAAHYDLQVPFPHNWRLLAQVYGCPRVVGGFSKAMFFTGAWLPSPTVSRAHEEFKNIPIMPTGTGCMVTAYRIAALAGASKIVALGIDLEFAFDPEKRQHTITEKDPTLVKQCKIKTPEGIAHVVSTPGYLRMIGEFRESMAAFRAEVGVNLRLGGRLYPAPLMHPRDFIRRAKHDHSVR